MSGTPTRRASWREPEVVVYTSERPSSSSLPARRRNAERDGTKSERTEGGSGGGVDKAEEAAGSAGLSRIEQMRLRVRQKVEEEERDKEQRQSKREVPIEEDEEDEDELPDLNTVGQARSVPSSSLSSAPAPSSSNGAAHPSFDTSQSIPDSQSHEASKSPTPSRELQRSRRKTARLEPYIFRPSLDPVSERRRGLELAKESAAVQAKIMKQEDFKKSAHRYKGDPIERILREQKREQKKGMDVDGLQATIELMVETGRSLREETEMERMEVDKDGRDQGSESDRESSQSSSSESRASPLPITPHEQRNRVVRSRAVFVNDESDNEQGQEAFDILVKDRHDADRRKEVGEMHDVGLKDRQFWTGERVASVDVVFSALREGCSAFDMIGSTISAGPHQSEALASILESGALGLQLNRNKEERGRVVLWLVDLAVLSPTGELPFAALDVLEDIKIGLEAKEICEIIGHIPQLLIKLGARREIIEACFESNHHLEARKVKAAHASTKPLRRRERTRRVERLLRVVQSLCGSRAEANREDSLQLFLCLLNLSVDPEHRLLGICFDRVLRPLLDMALQGEAGADETVFAALVTLLEGRAPTARREIVAMVPSGTLRTRAIQRCLAYHLIVGPERSKGYASVVSDYATLADVLSSGHANVNVVLARGGRDYKQAEANVELVAYCFNDLTLQLCSPSTGGQGETVARGALAKRMQSHLDQPGSLDAFLASDEWEQGKVTGEWEVREGQIEALHRIMDALQHLSNQIQDGKGAFLDRSRVKDLLQRIRLMLLYELSSYGLAGNKAPTTLQQGTLSKWIISG